MKIRHKVIRGPPPQSGYVTIIILLLCMHSNWAYNDAFNEYHYNKRRKKKSALQACRLYCSMRGHSHKTRSCIPLALFFNCRSINPCTRWAFEWCGALCCFSALHTMVIVFLRCSVKLKWAWQAESMSVVKQWPNQKRFWGWLKHLKCVLEVVCYNKHTFFHLQWTLSSCF